MKVDLPELCLVVLIGPSGSGKSTFARQHFLPTEIVSSDVCRGLVSDDENDQEATTDAFQLLHEMVRIRLRRGRLTVVDATNVRAEDRRQLVQLAREYHVLPTAIILDLPEGVCHARNAERPDRQFGKHVVKNQRAALRRSRKSLQREGFRKIHNLRSEEDVAAVELVRTKLWNDRKHDSGPFDIIGDIHGCFDETIELVEKLGYGITREEHSREGDWKVDAPRDEDGRPRKLLFLGDLVDRGPKTPSVLRFVMRQVADGVALCVPGNHERKLTRALQGKRVRVAHGLAESLEQLEQEDATWKEQAIQFMYGLVSHLVLDAGRLVVSHAGLREEMQGRSSARVRDFCLYGESTGEIDEFGLPVRYPWAKEYRGDATVVYGHTPIPEPEWLNRTINIDTGCVFGGKLTALRYPENELVQIDAHQVYAEPVRPLALETESETLSAQQLDGGMLHLEDVSGKRILEPRLRRSITIREENAAAALESMTRFAIDPRWLIYLPPTMAPSPTSDREDCLEYPEEAFESYARAGVSELLCEEKHMGSRGIIVVTRDDPTTVARFGIPDGGPGACFSRTGRPFFLDAELNQAFLMRCREAVTRSGLWEELKTDWLLLDAEIMPWSMKAQSLLQTQYAPVGSAGQASVSATAAALDAAAARDVPGAAAMAARMHDRHQAVVAYTEAYRRYCWPVSSLDQVRVAPFHLLASEGTVHHDMQHDQHLALLARLAQVDSMFQATHSIRVQVDDPSSRQAAIDWWEDQTGAGGEGMVIKPLDFVAIGKRGLLQPAMKCRGREYLRIIYGPEYLIPDQLDRLRKRGLRRKQGLALSEFALGVEALERFVRNEPLRRVHECVFGVLALESEPVDPRL